MKRIALTLAAFFLSSLLWNVLVNAFVEDAGARVVLAFLGGIGIAKLAHKLRFLG
jgi:hypothetical protein